jgi:signal transduction histidine kinase
MPSWEFCDGTDQDCDGFIDNAPAQEMSVSYSMAQPTPPENIYADNSMAQQTSRGVREYAFRNASNNAQMQQLSIPRVQEPVPSPSPTPRPKRRRAPPRTTQRQANVSTGIFTPLWQDGELFLVRSLMVGNQRYVQGLWIDWPEFSKFLLSDVHDLLPNATLTPATGQMQRTERRLAALPAELVPGALVIRDEAGGAPAWWLLVIAWSGVSIAVGAVGLLLWGAVELSERRGAFVSAVTHELRTPLTTFRLYTEMLSEGMVPTEQRRHEYIETLRREAGRLSHLVENVLSFSRVEQGRRPGPFTPVEVRALLDRIAPGLQERVAQSGRTIEMEVEAEGLRVRVDAAAVEQILQNLVDNACKYATGEDSRVHLEVVRRGRQVVFSVRDHGPGIDALRRRRLFEPFSKSAAEAATSAPGVGLGLALCRQLARSRGGDLKYEAAEGGGTRFSFSLPVARP